MPLAAEKVELVLRSGDVAAVVKYFEHATEPERRAIAPAVLAWCRRLNLHWRAQFSEKAAAEVAKSGRIENWYEVSPAANAAALACATLAEIKALENYLRRRIESAVEILSHRRPDWINEYAELLCEGELRTFGGHWKHVRALVRAGLCGPPKHPHYVLEALNCIWPRFNKDLPRPNLIDLLLNERDWLEIDFWRLFELDGNGEVSIANCEKYRKSKDTWTDAIVELSRRGVLSRDRLLDVSLEALGRDFIQFRAGWFSRFHEALQPTPAERAARIDAYLHLLASSIAPTVAFAVDAVATVDKTQPLAASKLTAALQPVLNARGKALVKTALKLLDTAAKREPAERAAICLAATTALLNEATDVQKNVFDLLDRHGDKQDKKLRLKLKEFADAVAASLKPPLKQWLGEPATRPQKPAARNVSPSQKIPSRIDPARAIQPISNLDDLIHLAGIVLEEPANPDDIERLLDGISRLCDQRPDDLERRTSPLRNRALKKRDTRSLSWFASPSVERGLAMLILTWLDVKNGFTEKPEDLGRGQNQYAFLFRRLAAIGRHVEQRRAMPLLSAPTHTGGWIESRVLAKRWLAWQKSELDLDIHEQVLALMRLAPEARNKALPAAKELMGEAGQALRLALGEDVKTGANAPLWLAAWRSRQPHGDLPEFEKKHPRLGPDAGVAAKYSWQIGGELHQYREAKWTSLKLELQREPAAHKDIGDALLPVLFHGDWNTSEEGETHLLRWAAQLWPANREASFAHASARVQHSVNYADVSDREFAFYLEPLTEPHTELRPMACLALALGLAAQDTALRNHAQDGLIAAIAEGRLNPDELGVTMSLLLDTGLGKFSRWAKVLRETARVSPAHASAAADLITRALHCDPAKAPNNISVFLELLFELLSETGHKFTDPRAREYISKLPTGGKAAKLVKQLLAM